MKIFFKNCLNATTLAYNGGCTERIAYQDGHNFHTRGEGQKGRCGKPGTQTKLFSPPVDDIPTDLKPDEQNGLNNGWLWNHMLRFKDPIPFHSEVKTQNCFSFI